MRGWIIGLALVLTAAAPGGAASRRFVGTTTGNGLESRTTVAKVTWTQAGDGGTFTAKFRCKRSPACPARGVGKVSGAVQSYRFGGDFGGTVTFKRGAVECSIAGSLFAADGVSLWENDQPAADAPIMVFSFTCGDDVEYTSTVAAP